MASRRSVLKSYRARVAALCVVLLAGLALDVTTPRGFSDWVVYLLVLIAATRVAGNRTLILLAAIASGCAVMGLVFSPPGQLIWISVFSRSFALILVWAIVWMELNWRQTDERLRRLEKAVDGSSEIVIMTDPKGVITFINPAFTEAYGYTKGEVVGKATPRILKGGHVNPEAYKVFWEMLLEKRPVRGEFINKTKEGRLLTVDVSASAIVDGRGNITGFLGIQRDITEHKLAEEEVQRSQARLAEAQRSAQLGSWEWDIVHDRAFWSEEMHRIFGVNPQGPWPTLEASLNLVHPQDRGSVEAALNAAFKEATSYDIDYRIVRPDGAVRFVHAQGEVQFDETRKPVRMVGTIQDITERKQAEKELQRLNQDLKTISECNQALVRANNETELLKTVCQILVDHGGYRLAWVGYAEQDEAKRVRPVAFVGHEDGYLDQLDVSWADEERGRGPTGTAIRTGRPSTVRHIQSDPSFDPWRAEATRRGYVCSTALPLIVGGQTLGALSLYSADPSSFDTQEMELLNELINDLAYGVAALRNRNERWRAEEALRESEQKYRELVQHANSIILHWTRDGRILFLNEFGQHFFGYTEAEICGRHVIGTLVPETDSSGENLSRLMDEICANPAGFEQNVNENMRRNGERVWIAWTNKVEPGKQGQDAQILSIGTDVTERKRAEDELYQSRQMLQNILDTLPQRVFWKDRNFSYLGCNKAFAMDAGLRNPAEIMGKHDDELAWRESAESYRADDQLVMEGATPRLNFEETQSRPDGSLSWLRTSKLPMRDREGRVIGLIGIYEDITGHKRADAALESSEIRYRRLFEAAKDGILILDDATGEITDANPFLTHLLGYPREEVVGKKLWELGVFKDIFASKRKFAELQSGAYIRYENLPLLRRDGQAIDVEFVSNVYRVDGVKVIQCNIRDITERVAAKEELKKAQEQLLQAQKMEAVGRLAGGVAHDFNNLLTIINGYTELLLENAPAESQERDSLDEINRAGQRAAALTSQLLTFSRKQVAALTILDLNSIVEGTNKMLHRLIGEDIKLVATLAPDLGRIKADPGQVEQVIMNLAVNARDAMPNGGTLTIETSNVELGEEYSRSHTYAGLGSYIMLALSDTGCGMDPETQSHIFEPFYTTKSLGKGTGLGLSTVYGIVKQSGGHVNVYSEVGRGTTFRVYFPQVNEIGEPIPEKAEPVASASGRETVLLVEDEPGVRNLTEKVLQVSGYNVLTAAGPGEALTLAADHQGAIHLLLTDVIMPGINGKELADRIALTRPEIATLFISGYTADAIGQHGILEKGVDFLPKPFSPRDLLRKIRQTLGGNAAG